MIDISDVKKIFDSLPIAVLIGSPIRNTDGIPVDFKIDYMNDSFVRLTNMSFKEGNTASTTVEKLSSDVDWMNMLHSVMETKETAQKNFYSFICKCHLRMLVSSLSDDRFSLTLQNVTDEVESQQQLKRQNSRLAALTEELSLNRASLQTKLAGIQSLNEQLRYSAYYDPLTTLRNRASLNQRLVSAIDEANKNGTKFGLLFLDIDNFKSLNDSKGHSAGDEFIIRLGSLLHGIETNSISTFRFESDEFYVLMRHIKSKQPLLNIGNELIRKVNELGLGLSGGIALYPDDASDAENILKYTDLAAGEAKRQGKNRICDYENRMNESFLKRVEIEHRLSKAVNDKLFQLYYQPQFDVDSGKLRGFEALLRWHDENLGWVSPEKFISIAEESRLVIPIGDWVLDTALMTLSQWERNTGFDGILSVNVSPLQFKEQTFLKKLHDKVLWSKINPKHLEIEITEGIFIDDFDSIVQKLNSIKDMHIGISLDDFGTGYSSIRYLQTLPLSTLKIDKSFIENISLTGNKDTAITQSVVSLVDKMGLNTIAEGVETDDQLKTLKSFNTKNITVQGFLKGKPMPRYRCDRLLCGDSSALLTINDDGNDEESGADEE